jgi:RpiR family carbohydrate utilization transcriptional regulator
MLHNESLVRGAGANIIEAVRQTLDDLRKSERKVADRVLEDPHRVLHATLAEAAALSGVSEPTVIRFCTAIGCTGYQEFKLRLAHSLALGVPPTHSVLSEGDKPETLVEKIFGYTLSSLDWARSHLDIATIEKAVDTLVNARRIEFFGMGASNIVALDAQQKFPLFGVPCGAQADIHQQLATASSMQFGDVAVVFSNSGQTQSMIEAAKSAHAGGAKVIGVSGAQSPLFEHCDISILVATLDNADAFTPTISRIAALVVVDVLSSAVGLRHKSSVHEREEAVLKELHGVATATAAGPLRTA